jgi:hypothetical protein
MHTKFLWRTLKERPRKEVPGVYIIKMDFKEIGWNGAVWVGLI